MTQDVSLLDVLPTLRALLGAPASRQDQGLALLDELWTEERAPRPLFAMRHKHDTEAFYEKRAVVFGKFKLIYYVTEGDDELYDLEVDPLEQNDIAARHPELVERLHELIAIQEANARGWGHASAGTFNPNEDEVDLLEALGYTGEVGEGGGR